MIYIVEAFVEDYLHVLANVNIIKIFKKVYKDESVTFISPEKHNIQVKKYFNPEQDNISFQSIGNLIIVPTNILSRIFLILSRIYRDFKILRLVFNKCKPGDKVVITHIYFPSLVLLKLVKKMYPKVATFSVIHGDVEYVYYPTTKGQKVVGFFHELMFKISVNNFYYLFLTPTSKQILVETNKIRKDEIFAIELPTFPNENKFEKIENFSSKILKIGHIGSAGVRKNVQFFYDLASRLSEQISKGDLEFSNVGVLETSIEPFLNSLIKNYVNDEINKPLRREVYDGKISTLHYSIFFYGKNDFILRSSAAFFDAIYYEKPLIVLRNTFFENVFKKEGEIGYLCENLEEMAILISNLIEQGEVYTEKYLLMVQNVKNYKAKLSIDEIASTLKKDVDFNNINN